MYELCELFQQIITGQHFSSLEPGMLTTTTDKDNYWLTLADKIQPQFAGI